MVKLAKVPIIGITAIKLQQETVKKELYRSMFCIGADAALITRIQHSQMRIVEAAGDMPPELKDRSFSITNTLPETAYRNRKTLQVMFDHTRNLGVQHPVYSSLQIDGYIGVPVMDELECLGLIEFIFLERSAFKSVTECIEQIEDLAAHLLRTTT